MHFQYLDVLPWQLRVYWHTFACRGAALAAQRLVPAEQRASPNVIELQGALGRHVTLRCVVRFERAFMHWTEFPPDAHRGYDMGAAVLELQRPRARASDLYRWSPAMREADVIIF